MKNVTNFQISPFKVDISEQCKKMIKDLIWYSPSQRPSIKDLLMSDYVKEMCERFKWDLSKLLKMKKMSSLECQNPNMNNSQLDTSFNQPPLLDLPVKNKSNEKIFNNQICLNSPTVKTKMTKTNKISHHYETSKEGQTLQINETDKMANSSVIKNQKTFTDEKLEIDLDILESGVTIESTFISPFNI